jgi:hypothetical protein
MTSDEKRAYWKRNWNYGMTELEVLAYRIKKGCLGTKWTKKERKLLD